MTPPEVIDDLAHTVSEDQWRLTRVVIELAAVTSGAMMGSLHGIKRRFDVIGVIVIGLLSGLGGGMVRDVLIARGPVLALQRKELLLCAFVSATIGMILGHRTHHLIPITWFVEALALGLFTVTGIQRAEEAGLGVIPAIFLGVVTGTCGGLLRDVVCREVPVLVLPGRPFAMAALLGGCAYYAVQRGLDFPRVVCEWMAVLVTFGVRVTASWRKWEVRPPDEMFRLPPSLRKRIAERLRGLGRRDPRS